MSQQSLADALGVKRPTITNYESGTSFPAFRQILDIVRLFDVSSDYLLGLSGTSQNVEENVEVNVEVTPVLQNQKYISEPAPAYKLQEPQILVATQDASGNPTYSVINYKAAANYLSGYESQEYYEELSVVTLPRQLVGTTRQGIILQLQGDSMETKFHHGDYVAAVLLEPHEYDQIKDLDAYIVVSSTYGIQFKRIKNRLRSHGFIRCRSDNRKHHSYNIEAENLLQLFRFVLHFSPDASNPNDDLYGKLDNLEDTTTDLRLMYEQMREELHEMRTAKTNPPQLPGAKIQG